MSDRKFGVSSAGSSLIDHYEPHIVTAQDYYPFGMLSRVSLPGNDKSYAFGFNGKMNDNEVKGGVGNQQDYGMRIYDGRVGRFLSLDPLQAKYPYYTPYSFAGNKPTVFIDRDGEEEALEMYTRRQEEALLSHKITPEEYKRNIRTRAMGGIIGGAIVGDVFFTKGKLTQTAIKATAAWGYFQMVDYTNANSNQHDPKIKAENDKKAKQLATDLVIGFGVGYLFTKGLQAGKMVYQEAKGLLPDVDPMTAEMSQYNGPMPSVSKGTTIGLGVSDDLPSFRRTGAITWRNAGWQEAGLTKVDYGKMYIGDEYAIKEAFRDAVKNADAIKFDVTNFDPFYSKPGITNYEFNYITSDPALMQKTTFIRNGGEVSWDGKTFTNK